MAKLCLGCMKQKEQSPVCEHCGYNENVPNYPHQLPLGTVLKGQYTVGKVLGQGGFGITYLGWDNFLDVPVAIKEYFPNSFVARECSISLNVGCAGEEAERLYHLNRERFLREAKILAKLQNIPGVVKVQNLFPENNTAYIIMEYIEGIDLKRYIRMQGRVLTVPEVFSVLRPIMDALIKVHDAELVHRDLSPDNIMIQPDGTAKLLDFGAAREVENADVHTDLPQSTESILKHGFAPLEQYRRRGSLGPWTDVYALCSTIYYCLTGRVPNSAPERILGDDNVNWHQIPDLNEQQISVLEKGMELVPENRLQSIRELREGLYPRRESIVTPLKSEPEVRPVSDKNTSNISEEKSVKIFEAKPTEYSDYVLDSEKQNTVSKIKDTVTSDQFFSKTTPKKNMVGIIVAALLIVVAAISIFAIRPKEPSITTELNVPETTTVETTSVFIENTTVIEETTTPVIEEPVWAKNILMADSTYEEDSAKFWEGKTSARSTEIDNYFSNRPVFNSDIPRSKITEVFFLDSVSTAPEDAWDVSQNQNGSVLAWVEKNPQGKYNLHIAGEGGINASVSCKFLFNCYTEVNYIHFDGNFHTDYVEDMSSMFDYCHKLKGLDLSSFNTSNVTNMSNMFTDCEKLEFLDLSSFDTSKVTSFNFIFACNKNLSSIDVSHFNTSSAVNMSGMFHGCSGLDSLDVSNFDTSNVTSMYSMFLSCGSEKLTTIDVSNFNTSNVTDMGLMFNHCVNLKTLDLSNFDTSNVTNMSEMFSYCYALTSLDIGNWDVSNVTTYSKFMENGKLINGAPWESLFTQTGANNQTDN